MLKKGKKQMLNSENETITPRIIEFRLSVRVTMIETFNTEAHTVYIYQVNMKFDQRFMLTIYQINMKFDVPGKMPIATRLLNEGKIKKDIPSNIGTENPSKEQDACNQYKTIIFLDFQPTFDKAEELRTTSLSVHYLAHLRAIYKKGSNMICITLTKNLNPLFTAIKCKKSAKDENILFPLVIYIFQTIISKKKEKGTGGRGDKTKKSIPLVVYFHQKTLTMNLESMR